MVKNSLDIEVWLQKLPDNDESIKVWIKYPSIPNPHDFIVKKEELNQFVQEILTNWSNVNGN